MAVVTKKITRVSRGVLKIVWANMANGDTGALFDAKAGCPALSDKCVMFIGNTWGSGGSVKLEGTNDDTNFFTLNDPLDNTLVATGTNALDQVLENPQSMRPSVTAGDGTTDITVTLIARAVLVKN